MISLQDALQRFQHLANQSLGKEVLDRASKVILIEAKSELGRYQPAAGSSPAWAALSQSTMDERVSKGFSADEPLLRTGHLRDSIERHFDEHQAVIGSDDPYAIVHEMGSMFVPPRPFLAGAVYRKENEVEDAVFNAVVDQIVRFF